MATRTVTEAELTGLADHIRGKTGVPGGLTWSGGFEAAIDGIPTYGVADAGKVVRVEGGTASLVQQGTVTVGVNGPVDTTEVRELTVAVAPYAQPVPATFSVQAAGPVRIYVIVSYTRPLVGWNDSDAVIAFDGTTWTVERSDGAATHSVQADPDDPNIGIITAAAPSNAEVYFRGYIYLPAN